MKVKLLREAKIRHYAGEIVEVSPAEAGFLFSTKSAVKVPVTTLTDLPDEKMFVIPEKETPEAEAERRRLRRRRRRRRKRLKRKTNQSLRGRRNEKTFQAVDRGAVHGLRACGLHEQPAEAVPAPATGGHQLSRGDPERDADLPGQEQAGHKGYL